jgi:hypothetical protein
MAEKLPRVVIVGGGFGGLAAGGDRRPEARADYIPIVVADACGAGHQEAGAERAFITDGAPAGASRRTP